MRKVILFLLFGLISISVFSQIRNGWRSIYDKDGRLSRMNYYENGEQVTDSNLFYQYFTENIPKVIVKGEIDSKVGSVNGSISMFDQTGMLTSYHIKRGGQMIFDVNCDYYGNCSSVWQEAFNVESGSWVCDSFSITNGDLVIHNKESICAAVYNPEVPIDLNQPFVCQLSIPVEGNTANQGLALGWKDENNFFLFEILFGNYYSIQEWKNGEKIDITEGRQKIERPDSKVNVLQVYRKNQNLILEINGSIQNVLAIPDFQGDKIALVTRSRGNAHFSDLTVKYSVSENAVFFDNLWVGKGTGFFISSSGKILTTYDNVMDAKRIRVIGKAKGKNFVIPAKIIRVEEENNLAVLQIDSAGFTPFDTLTFGYMNHAPTSDSKVFCIGFPNAISGKYSPPEVFEGRVLPGTASSSGNRMLQLDFRNGMVGAPVFNWDFDFLGIVSQKGTEIKYTEMIDFYNNSHLFIANFGLTERRLDSPYTTKSYNEKYQLEAPLVVMIETSMF